MDKVGTFLHEISEACPEPHHKLGIIAKIGDTIAYVQCLGVINVDERETAVLFFEGVADYPSIPNKEVRDVWDVFINTTDRADKNGE